MHITVKGINDEAFLSDTLGLSQELLTEMLATMKAIDGFTPEEEDSRNHRISELIVDISRFVEVTTLLSKFIMLRNKDVLSSAKGSHVHLLFVMKGISVAQQKQDLVALEELIKYELNDNLTQWKIDLIPQIKRLLQS